MKKVKSGKEIEGMKRRARSKKSSVASERKRRNRMSDKKFTVVSNAGGMLLVLCCAGLCVVGTTSAVNALNRSAAMQLSQAKDRAPVIVTEDTGRDAAGTTDVSGAVSEDSEFSTAQLDWAKQYHITWDSYGNPMDEKGQVMNDPTTDVNEVARAISDGTANANGVSLDYLVSIGAFDTPAKEAEPVVPAVSYEGVPNVSQTGDGQYVYTVQSGDSLNYISQLTGVSVADLVKDNQISDASVIQVGQQIVLPSAGVVNGASGAGLG